MVEPVPEAKFVKIRLQAVVWKVRSPTRWYVATKLSQRYAKERLGHREQITGKVPVREGVLNRVVLQIQGDVNGQRLIQEDGVQVNHLQGRVLGSFHGRKIGCFHRCPRSRRTNAQDQNGQICETAKKDRRRGGDESEAARAAQRARDRAGRRRRRQAANGESRSPGRPGLRYQSR